MFKKQLMNILVGVTIFSAGTASIGGFMSNPTVAQAATTQNKVKYTPITIKRGARLYKLTFNKQKNKVVKVSAQKRKGVALRIKGGKSQAVWSTTYKRTKYYYIGGVYAIRAKDAKVQKGKSVPSLSGIIAKQVAKQEALNEQRKQEADNWNQKLQDAKPQTVAAKVTKDSQYFTVDSNGKGTKATDELKAGTSLNIIYSDASSIKTSDGKNIPAYFAKTDSGTTIVIPIEAVTLDNKNDHVLTADEYNQAIQNVNNIYSQAKNALNLE